MKCYWTRENGPPTTALSWLIENISPVYPMEKDKVPFRFQGEGWTFYYDSTIRFPNWIIDIEDEKMFLTFLIKCM